MFFCFRNRWFAVAKSTKKAKLLTGVACLCSNQRITIREIKSHPWFLKNLPRELTETAQAAYYRRDNTAPTYSLQSIEAISKIIEEAKTIPKASRSISGYGWAEESDEEEGEENREERGEEEDEDEYDKTVKEVHASGEFNIGALKI